MARRGVPKGPVIWFLRDWMRVMNVESQVMLQELTGWSKAKASMLVNDKQDFNSEVLTEAAHALNVKPYELLMPPEDAMALRDFRRSARVISDRQSPFFAEDENGPGRRSA
jgi:hypothetical protein